MSRKGRNLFEERNKNVAGRDMSMRLKKKIVVQKGRESIKEWKTNKENWVEEMR